MIPRQIDEIARQHTQLMRLPASQASQASQASPVGRSGRSTAGGRRALASIRNHTGWSLVQIGLRIAESGGR